MGGRAIPTYCEHGVMVDGGGHFDDVDDCEACESGEVARTAPVLAIGAWRTNAELIRDVARLGYLDGHVIDLTYGLGNFWTEWTPQSLMGNDISKARDSDCDDDFRRTRWADDTFDAVVFDPPYRLNGTPDQGYDDSYGIAQPTRWQDRMAMILDGVQEACRISRRHVLVKCQAQVVSGKVVWQDYAVVDAASYFGFQLVDRFDLVTPQRPQPTGRRQVHARRNHSTLLVFGKASRPVAGRGQA